MSREGGRNLGADRIQRCVSQMPPLPASPGQARWVVYQQGSGRTWGNYGYVSKEDGLPWDAAQLSTLASAVAGAWETNMAPVQAATVSYAQCEAYDLSNTTGARVFVPMTGSGTLTGSSDQVLSVCSCTTFVVNRRYRGGKPRAYLSGVNGTQLADYKSFSTTAAALIESKWGLFINDIDALSIGGLSVTSVGISYYLNKVLRTTPLVEGIVAIETQVRVCSQRRRLGKGLGEET